MLMQGFCHALARVKAAHSKFVMIGRRWDTEFNEPYDFERRDWQTRLRGHALHKGKERTPDWIDYFAFTAGRYGRDSPPFAVGRVVWGKGVVWQARDAEVP